MKFFPVVAALVLHAVLALKHDSNTDLDSSSMSFEDMSFEEMSKSLGVKIKSVDSFFASESESMAASASGSGVTETEAIVATAYMADVVDGWTPIVTWAMGNWTEPNSVEYKKFQKKMKKINALVEEMSRPLSGSMSAWESVLDQLVKGMEKVSKYVNDYVQNASKGARVTTAQVADMLAIADFVAQNYGSDKESITQTSVDSATQSSPSAQKTKNKLTESEAAEK